MHRPKDAVERLEEAVRWIHRLYLASVMHVEALEDAGVLPGSSEREAAEIDRELHFRLMSAQIDQLGYVPKGLAKRAEIRREMAAQGAALAEQSNSRPSRSARALARAEGPVRSA
ncbi:hypothetical protein LRS73_08620 [Methylobacterium currus]|uniref:hypothetical protein n=1 Tax=Methylobacterium currus TaxID=2051553 RepID=UPI001E64A209|nr:hypothetical protein [Methylobacterium currus]UHC17897.1 hypothetical protein LRS73_08620 [Methylobacterium currus]